MTWLAWRILTGNRPKYLGILFGISFASLLIAQQLSIFFGVLRMTTSPIRDVEEASVWVLTPNTRHVDDLRPMPDRDLDRVRSVPGVAWAVPLRRDIGQAAIDPPDEHGQVDGRFEQVMIIGIDDDTLVGTPRTLVAGRLIDLQRPDAVLVDLFGYRLLWPDGPVEVGRELTINARRAVVVGVCRASVTFQTLPLVYARASQAAHFLPPNRRTLSAILVRHTDDVTADEVCGRISAATGLLALTPDAFARRTIGHYLERTGLLLNFGTTVSLGFIVGVAISGQLFYMFTLENLPQLAMLKAMGASNRQLLWMIGGQAAVVGLIGYGTGVGLAALFGELSQGSSKLVSFMPWQVLVGTGGAVVLVTLLASAMSMRKVCLLEPGILCR